MSSTASTIRTSAVELPEAKVVLGLFTRNKQRLSKCFLYLTPALGTVAFVFCMLRLDQTRIDVRFLVLAAATICFGSRLGIEFSKHRIQITVSDSFIFLTLLLYGVDAAVMLAAADAFCTSFRFTDRWIIRVFNAGLLAITTFVTGSLIQSIFGSVVEIGRGDFSGNFVAAICLIAMCQFLVNSSLAALRQSLKLNLRFARLWKQHYLWTSITYLACASAAGVTTRLTTEHGFVAFIGIIPLIAILYFTYITYIKNVESSAARAETTC